MALICDQCGVRGRHITSECPWKAELGPRPVWDKPPPSRRPEHEIADASEWARRTRELMGWSLERQADRKRIQALEQVAESRQERGADLDAMFMGHVQ